MLTDEQVVEIIESHVLKQFPKTCSCCGQEFASLAEYVHRTSYIGDPVSADADLGDWQPEVPIGTLSYARCPCGTTLAIGSEGIGVLTMWRLLRWGYVTSRSRGIPLGQLLAEVRDTIDLRALRDDEKRREACD